MGIHINTPKEIKSIKALFEKLNKVALEEGFTLEQHDIKGTEVFIPFFKD